MPRPFLHRILFGAVLLAASLPSAAPAAPSDYWRKKKMEASGDLPEGPTWTTDLLDAQRKALSEGKPLYIYFSAKG